MSIPNIKITGRDPARKGDNSVMKFLSHCAEDRYSIQFVLMNKVGDRLVGKLSLGSVSVNLDEGMIVELDGYMTGMGIKEF